METEKNNSQNIDIQTLLDKMAELEQRLKEKEEQDENSNKVKPDDYVKVMSLLPYTLILTTREGGGGITKRFTQFGEIKRIAYRELIDIIEVNRSFLESGYFYIMNKDVVREQGLEEIYENILSKEMLEKVFSASDDKAVELFETANNRQQEVIVSFLIERVTENPDSVNLNVINKISQISGVEIQEKAKANKSIRENLASLEK